MKTRQQVEAEIRTDNPTSDNLTAGHPVYEALIAKWTDAGMADLATAAPPIVVTMTSLRLALIDAGLYQTITSAINGIADATEKLKAQTWWATAQTVRRAHPLVAGIAALAGRTDAQVDAIFAAAQALDNPTP